MLLVYVIIVLRHKLRLWLFCVICVFFGRLYHERQNLAWINCDSDDILGVIYC